ncbi:uncharacterized protein LOC122532140 [Frieseomelitta varia]|uniref:uncharacterized protein LOC122532140 n=1 Tax=Frieseomelitta varia TaxID=561572 RepID=UPI001CB693D2|nr:uncharacterized protein LOC122532140 [Frieseomelitta varia]
MKQLGSICKEKFTSLEEGLVPEARIFTQGARSASKNKACKQVAQCVKVILYLLFVGLAVYLMWQTFSINMMEFKVINSIRESQSEGLSGQRSTFDKSATNTVEEFHRFNDISTTEASDLDRKTSFTNETDDDESLKTDVVTESDDIYETHNEGVVGTTASTDEAEEITFTRIATTESPVESNSSLAQQMNERFYDNYDEDNYLVNDEMKLERVQEEILDNYALLSLIIQNAVRTSQIIDSFVEYDNSDNWGDSAALSPQNGNGVEEENSQGTQETEETLKLFINEGDYEEENPENFDYQIETVTESTAKDYYGQFYRRLYGPWRIYV